MRRTGVLFGVGKLAQPRFKPCSPPLTFPHPSAADSESSAVRRLDLRSGGSQACVGGDALFSDNLFR